MPDAHAALTTPVAPAAQGGALDRSLVRGLAWTGSVKWVAQLLAWASTLAVARILSPEDYGLVGMATVYLTLVTMVSEFGVGSAVVVLRDLDDDRIAQINTLAVVVGVLGFAVSCLAAVPLGRFFDAPQLPMVVVALSATLVVNGFRAVPTALLRRELRFRRLAAIEGAQAVVLAALSPLLALLGFRYWTLVLVTVLGAALATALVLLTRRCAFAVPRRRALGPALTFSGHTLVARLAWYAYEDGDFVVAGKILGKAALGAYGFAWTLATLPLEKVTSLVGVVTPSILAAVQTDRAALRRYVLSLTEGIAAVTMPAAIGLALVADELVPLVLGTRWTMMVTPLRLLAAYTALRALMPLLSQVLMVTQDTGYLMRTNVAAAVLLPAGFVVGSRWGIAGIALAWMIVHPVVVVLPVAHRAFRRLALPVTTYLDALRPALAGTAAMTAAVLAVGAALPADAGHAARLAAEVLVGMGTYALAVATLHRDRLRALARAASMLRGA